MQGAAASDTSPLPISGLDKWCWWASSNGVCRPPLVPLQPPAEKKIIYYLIVWECTSRNRKYYKTGWTYFLWSLHPILQCHWCLGGWGLSVAHVSSLKLKSSVRATSSFQLKSNGKLLHIIYVIWSRTNCFNKIPVCNLWWRFRIYFRAGGKFYDFIIVVHGTFSL